MSALESCFILLFCTSAAGTLLTFGLYPLCLRAIGVLRAGGAGAAVRTPASAPGVPAPRVSLLVAVRNAEGLLAAKLDNCRALRSPGELEVVFVSDGSTDGTAEVLAAVRDQRLRVLAVPDHLGKAAALDQAVRCSAGEILVFSDADALLAEDALEHLLRPFADPQVGGVSGQRVILEERGDLVDAQRGYIAADSGVKRAETLLGSTSSNDGKLYAMRRSLYRAIAPGATDDLYNCLSVVEQGRRFVFEPRARAFIRTPSRNARHELARRRRIVARSLHGIAAKRSLLNPLRHGFFSIQLLVNKVLRRMLPLFFTGLLVASAVLAAEHSWARLVLVGQLAFLALAAARRWLSTRGRLGLAAALAYYFCVGNLGTLLGVMDFVRGRVTVKWDPIKNG
jgi:cellulose synthase/poly-beta-1,6-N-acetylglucosamine synthase-like glycosyltransferase